MFASNMTSRMGSKEPGTSSDVARMEQLLKDAGVQEYEPRVVAQLLEIAHMATRRVLESAKAVSTHCEKAMIDENDVQLALEFTKILVNQSAERERLIKMAAERNAMPLPAIRHNFGLKLPNDRFCLLQPNLEWRAEKRTEEDDVKMMGGGRMQHPTSFSSMGSGGHSMQHMQHHSQQQLHHQVRPEHVSNMLKRPAPDDYD
ncbi:taf-9 [Pristionchus pacificus]|uniref:Taf-9 n=1 Tax=Pristionchus pacificus TaxID=54126 RepID=A0A2A6CEJ0_PRIPA|nr:taf-9 [Pristionchus pacificus]|eukprot:PDM76473.1 taf-9 [Pristionchus pacificus]